MASGYSSTIYFPNQNGTAKQYKVTINITETADTPNTRSSVTITAKIQPNGSTWQGSAKTMSILWNDVSKGSTSLTSLLSNQSETATATFYVSHDATTGAASGTVKIKIAGGSTYYTAPDDTTVSAGTAKLNAIALPITYNANGGRDAPSKTYIKYGQTGTLTTSEPYKYGYNFLGWSTSSTAATPSYSSGGSFTSPGTTTLYAVWQLIELPNIQLSFPAVKPKNLTIKTNISGTVSYIKKSSSPVLSQLITNYPDLPLCVMEDGSVWLRVFNHDNKGGTVLWSSDETLNIQSVDKYSRLHILDSSLKDINNKFEFMLRYPANSAIEMNRWKQTNAPQDEYTPRAGAGSPVEGYEAVNISWTTVRWGGLENSQGDYTFIDGSTGHVDWWYAIGAYKNYQGGIPGPDDMLCWRQVELWVRVPNATGIVLPTEAETNLEVTNIEPETEYLFCARAINDGGTGFSTVSVITTPADQAIAYIKYDGSWHRGKLYIKENGNWVKSKKVYIKKDSSWFPGINN